MIFLNFQHSNRVDPGKWFVEQDKAWIGRQRTGDFDAPPFATGQRRGIDLAHVIDVQFTEQAFEPAINFRIQAD